MVPYAPGWIKGRLRAVSPLWYAAKRLLVFVWSHFPSRQAIPLGLKMLRSLWTSGVSLIHMALKKVED
jgi:hypothetical protein